MDQHKLQSMLKRVQIFHIYIQKSYLPMENFTHISSYEIDEFIKANFKSNILLVELSVINKDALMLLSELVKKYSNKQIHIFSSEPEKTFLLKLALHYGLNKIQSLQDINEKNLEKLIFQSAKKVLIDKDKLQHIEVSKKVNSFFAFLIFRHEKLLFANEKAKEIFECDDLKVIENIAKSDQAIYSLIEDPGIQSGQTIIVNCHEEHWKYNVFVNDFSKSDDLLIALVPNRVVSDDEAYLATLNRFKFVEELKNTLAQNIDETASIMLMMINISNYEKIVDACGSIQVHDFTKKFIQRLSSYKEQYQDLVQWNPHFFIILQENCSFDLCKDTLEMIHQKLVYSEIDKKIAPVITSSLWRIDALQINEIIKGIERVNKHEYESDTFAENSFFEIHHLNDYEDEEEQIAHYMQSCVSNGTKLRLLNIYKGLCINTYTRVIKVNKDGSYIIHCESLQGYSMQFDNNTVIQSPDLPGDVKAEIVYVNIDKSQALIKDLEFLQSSANNREHTRVQPSFRTPVNLKYQKNSFHGEIIDISTHALALKFNHSLSEELKNKQVELNFKLPDENAEMGYMPIYCVGEVIYVGEINTTKSKVVVLMNFEQPYDGYLLRYMYNRQKELIFELKRVTKINNKKR